MTTSPTLKYASSSWKDISRQNTFDIEKEEKSTEENLKVHKKGWEKYSSQLDVDLAQMLKRILP